MGGISGLRQFLRLIEATGNGLLTANGCGYPGTTNDELRENTCIPEQQLTFCWSAGLHRRLENISSGYL
jgi:hypothetical protein